MVVKPIFNQIKGRPFRWALMNIESGNIYERPYFEENRFIHWIDKPTSEVRDIFSIYTDSIADFKIIRQTHVGFLSTQHRDFHEEGKYTEVWNDPVNYITIQPTDYPEAYLQAEQRIGNYRIGARRNITHLGGTISDDQLDDLSTVVEADFHPDDTVTFPFFPKLPTDYLKSPRINLITTDLGYVNFLKSMHPKDTTPFTALAEQGNAFRRFIYAQGAQTSSSSPTLTQDNIDAVQIDDIETVLDAAIATDVEAAGITTFLPVAGEDITVNIPGQHIIRSNAAGFILEMYSDATLLTLTTSIDVDKTSGNIILTAGTTTITVTKDDDIILTDSANTITMDKGVPSITITNGGVTATLSGSVLDVS